METSQKNQLSRNDLYAASPDLIKDLYSGEDTGELLWNAAVRVGINGGKSYRTFALAVGDVILGIHKKSSLPQILKDGVGLTEEQVNTVLADIKTLLDKLPETNSSITSPIPNFERTPDPTSVGTNNANYSAVKPLRTFAMDVDVSRAHSYGAFQSEEAQNDEDEPVHSSNQDDILKK